MTSESLNEPALRGDAHRRPACVGANVGGDERILTGLAGGVLVGVSLVRPTLVKVGLGALGAMLVARAIRGHCGIYQALGIDTAQQDSAIGVRARRGFKYEDSILVQRSPGEIYAFWRRLENLLRLFEHLRAVTELGEGRSCWVAVGPLDQEIDWEAEIINERPGELIAWRSIPGSKLDTAGSVHFDPASSNRGTIVRLSLKYDPPGGKAGATIARLLGKGLEGQVARGLWTLKQIMEVREFADWRQ